MPTKYAYPVKEGLAYGVGGTVSFGAGRDYHLPAGNVWVGGTNTGFDVRSYVQFGIDFSDVASVTSATLYLTTARENDGIVADYTRAGHGTFGSATMYVKQVTDLWSAGVRGNNEVWTEDNALNWLNKPTNNGSTNRFSIATYATRPATPTLVAVTITSLVQAWLASPTANYGIELAAATETSSNIAFQEYYSSHAQTDGLIAGAVGPYLEIVYTEQTQTTRPRVTAITPRASTIGQISNLTSSKVWTGTSYSASPKLQWSILLGNSNSPIKSWRLRIWEGPTVNTSAQIFESGTVTAEPYLSLRSLELDDTLPTWLPGAGWMVAGKRGLVNGEVYSWALTATDQANVSGSIAATPFSVVWGQAIYEFDAGPSWSQTSQWEVTSSVPERNTTAGLVYRALSAPSGMNGSATLSYAKGGSASMTYTLSAKNAYVSGVNTADGTFVTFAGTNTFGSGDYINVSGISTSTQYNLSNVSVVSATGTSFTVAAAATGSFSHTGNNQPYAYSAHPFNQYQLVDVTGITTSAGSNTYNVTGAIIGSISSNNSGTISGVSIPSAGTVRYTASNAYSVGDRVTIYGVNPLGYNLANATVVAATTASFDVVSASTGTYVSSAGRAFANTFTVNQPGSATYSSGGTAEIALSGEISDVIATGRYLNTTVRLTTTDGVNQPYLESLNFEYITSVQTPDNWYSTNGAALLDTSVRRFGTKSAKFTSAGTVLITETVNIANATGDGTVVTYGATNYFAVGNVVTISGVSPSDYNLSGVTVTAATGTSFSVAGSATATYTTGGIATRTQYDSYLAAGDAYATSADVSVVQNTDYTISAYVKPDVITAGNEIRIRVYEGGPSLGAILADSGPHTDSTQYQADNEGWYRLSATFNSGIGRSSVRPTIYLANNAGVNGNTFWTDGASLEEGAVVRSWTPGFVTTAITFEGGGMNIDGYGGGSFRLRGFNGGNRDVIELGANGLDFGGAISPVSVYSESSSTLTVGGTINATDAISVGSDAGLFRQSANKLATSDTFVLTGGTIEFGSSNDVNLYRASSLQLKTDDAFSAKNIARGQYNATISGADTWNITGLSVITSVGAAAGSADFSVLTTFRKSDTVSGGTAIIAVGTLTISSGTLTAFAVQTVAAGDPPTGFDWLVVGA